LGIITKVANSHSFPYCILALFKIFIMPLWLAIIFAILILGFLIFIHELGHFLMAKKNGVKVEAFGIGFGPKLIKKKVGDTVYSLNIIPFGGYVQLYGEDETDGGILQSKHSFASKTPWQRIEILLAGVVMNLLVAIVLLTIGIGFGMDPIIGDLDDFRDKLENSEILHVPNLVVKSVAVGSEADKAGIQKLARLVEIDKQAPETYVELSELLTAPLPQDHEFVFKNPDGQTVQAHVFAAGTVTTFGANMYSPANLLRPKVLELDVTNNYDLAVGDVILRINERPVFNAEDLANASLIDVNRILVYRGGNVVELKVQASNEHSVVISDVLEGSPAAKNLVPKAGILVAVNNIKVTSAMQASQTLNELAAPITLKLLVEGVPQEIQILEKDNGRIGVFLDEVIMIRPIVNKIVMSPLLGSIITAKKLQAPWPVAPFVAVTESYRLGKTTVKSFGSVVARIFTKFEVPDEVGGPVAVTQITTQFLRYDKESLIWLVALISLSLAVINVLPIPALDGGRILFVVIEVFRGGKKLHPRVESIIHLVGFVFLILLILIISLKDVIRLAE